MKTPTNIRLEGPITDADTLTKQEIGTACIDDVGTLRQRRYSSGYISGGWTAYGCDPIAAEELVKNGRPVWIIRYDMEQS